MMIEKLELKIFLSKTPREHLRHHDKFIHGLKKSKTIPKP
jgi:hypothetical protein